MTATKNMRVLLINNLSFDADEKITGPSHLLWGMVELNKKEDIEVIRLWGKKIKVLNFIGKLFRIECLDQQIRALWRIRKFDLIYAPQASGTTKLLILLKLFRIISTPIVILVHQPLFGYRSNSRIKRFIAKKLITKYDAVVFLSHAMKEEVIQNLKIPETVSKKRFFHADWGADTQFYKKYSIPKLPSETTFAISAGSTDRDFETIIEAFREINFPVKIFCTAKSFPDSKNIPKNISIVSTGIPFPDLLEQYNDARVIMIPLKIHQGGTQGLTSLVDALVMGKPVVMTANKYVDIDIQKEGIGYWVEQDNFSQWREILNKIVNDDSSLTEMGRKALMLHQEKYNAEIFANELEGIFNEVCHHTKSKKERTDPMFKN